MPKAENLYQRFEQTLLDKTVKCRPEWAIAVAILLAACIIAEAIRNSLDETESGGPHP